MIRGFLVLIAAFFSLAPPTAEAKKKIEIDVAGWPDEIVALYPTLRERCTKCHTLGRVKAVNRDMEPGDWEALVRKMRRKENNNISDEDAEKILKFLNFYMEKEKKVEAE